MVSLTIANGASVLADEGDPTATESPSAEPSPSSEPSPSEEPSPSTDPTPSPDPSTSPDPTTSPEPSPEPSPSSPVDPAPACDYSQLAPGPITASVSSDLADYPPGAEVTLTGGGFAPDEWICLRITEDNPEETWSLRDSVQADGSGNFVYAFNISPDFIAQYRVRGWGQTSGNFAETTFTDSKGAYSIDFAAADPNNLQGTYGPTYVKRLPSQVTCPTPSSGVGTGRANDPMPDAVFYGLGGQTSSQQDAVESLEPSELALGQIVPFELAVTVDDVTTPENGRIRIVADWATETGPGDEFGFDESYGVLCAFIDTDSQDITDPSGNAGVESYSWVYPASGSDSDIRGTFNLKGLDNGDKVVLEVWVVLDDDPRWSIGGNVQTELVSAKTCENAACTTGENISTGKGTVPLNQVRSSSPYNADLV